MYKNKEIILFAFASKDLSNSAKRLKIQAKETKYYDQIRILSPDDFDKDMQEIYQEILSTRSNRGYGYWFWKPFFLKKIMNEINEGDIVHYLDIGCHIQNKNNRFYDYLDLIFDNEKWIVTFQYHDNNNQFAKDISFSKREEFKYTKADLFEYYNFLENKDITHTPQFWAGSFFLAKKPNSLNFLDQWLKVFKENINLIDDSSSTIKNFDGFLENRHDQSVFSLLCKKNNIKSLSAYECEWGEKDNKRTWEHNFNNPVLAKRDLKYSIFKRFINRQVKTYKRYKKKIFN